MKLVHLHLLVPSFWKGKAVDEEQAISFLKDETQNCTRGCCLNGETLATGPPKGDREARRCDFSRAAMCRAKCQGILNSEGRGEEWMLESTSGLA